MPVPLTGEPHDDGDTVICQPTWLARLGGRLLVGSITTLTVTVPACGACGQTQQHMSPSTPIAGYWQLHGLTHCPLGSAIPPNGHGFTVLTGLGMCLSF